jgi:hypothetical protein
VLEKGGKEIFCLKIEKIEENNRMKITGEVWWVIIDICLINF